VIFNKIFVAGKAMETMSNTIKYINDFAAKADALPRYQGTKSEVEERKINAEEILNKISAEEAATIERWSM